MGYSPWGCKESDTTKRLIHTQFILILNIYTHKNTGEHNTYSIERLLLNHTKTPGFLAPGEEFNPGPETRLDRSELLSNKVLLKYKGDRESF